jgi:alkylated DNA repair protein (DNA oxidative demethylase)
VADLLALLGTSLIPGLAISPDVVTEQEEEALTDAIDRAGLSAFRFRGWRGKRETVSFGWAYDFDAGRLKQADALPEWLLPLREKAAGLADLAPEELVHALLTRYDPGAGIGWHKDRPQFEHVIGVSLGARATMRFRRRRGARFDRVNLPLEPRAAYHLAGEVRHEWEHSIAAQEATRWSITFRSLRRPAPKGRAPVRS